ncbi:titin homolog isoform X2 [Dreissena polymorpha]|uniref:titin homolog isoform X2 n=1 Tax=Dreissena polymorpha TaxID=45954 RepID=UPI0022641AAC|nr:titin homolog isoform X2 [Dreissena polymorpha]
MAGRSSRKKIKDSEIPSKTAKSMLKDTRHVDRMEDEEHAPTHRSDGTLYGNPQQANTLRSINTNTKQRSGTLKESPSTTENTMLKNARQFDKMEDEEHAANYRSDDRFYGNSKRANNMSSINKKTKQHSGRLEARYGLMESDLIAKELASLENKKPDKNNTCGEKEEVDVNAANSEEKYPEVEEATKIEKKDIFVHTINTETQFEDHVDSTHNWDPEAIDMVATEKEDKHDIDVNAPKKDKTQKINLDAAQTHDKPGIGVHAQQKDERHVIGMERDSMEQDKKDPKSITLHLTQKKDKHDIEMNAAKKDDTHTIDCDGPKDNDEHDIDKHGYNQNVDLIGVDAVITYVKPEVDVHSDKTEDKHYIDGTEDKKNETKDIGIYEYKQQEIQGIDSDAVKKEETHEISVHVDEREEKTEISVDVDKKDEKQKIGEDEDYKVQKREIDVTTVVKTEHKNDICEIPGDKDIEHGIGGKVDQKDKTHGIDSSADEKKKEQEMGLGADDEDEEKVTGVHAIHKGQPQDIDVDACNYDETVENLVEKDEIPENGLGAGQKEQTQVISFEADMKIETNDMDIVSDTKKQKQAFKPHVIDVDKNINEEQHNDDADGKEENKCADTGNPEEKQGIGFDKNKKNEGYCLDVARGNNDDTYGIVVDADKTERNLNTTKAEGKHHIDVKEENKDENRQIGVIVEMQYEQHQFGVDAVKNEEKSEVICYAVETNEIHAIVVVDGDKQHENQAIDSNTVTKEYKHKIDLNTVMTSEEQKIIVGADKNDEKHELSFNTDKKEKQQDIEVVEAKKDEELKMCMDADKKDAEQMICVGAVKSDETQEIILRAENKDGTHLISVKEDNRKQEHYIDMNAIKKNKKQAIGVALDNKEQKQEIGVNEDITEDKHDNFVDAEMQDETYDINIKADERNKKQVIGIDENIKEDKHAMHLVADKIDENNDVYLIEDKTEDKLEIGVDEDKYDAKQEIRVYEDNKEEKNNIDPHADHNEEKLEIVVDANKKEKIHDTCTHAVKLVEQHNICVYAATIDGKTSVAFEVNTDGQEYINKNVGTNGEKEIIGANSKANEKTKNQAVGGYSELMEETTGISVDAYKKDETLEVFVDENKKSETKLIYVNADNKDATREIGLDADMNKEKQDIHMVADKEDKKHEIDVVADEKDHQHEIVVDKHKTERNNVIDMGADKIDKKQEIGANIHTKNELQVIGVFADETENKHNININADKKVVIKKICVDADKKEDNEELCLDVGKQEKKQVCINADMKLEKHDLENDTDMNDKKQKIDLGIDKKNEEHDIVVYSDKQDERHNLKDERQEICVDANKKDEKQNICEYAVKKDKNETFGVRGGNEIAYIDEEKVVGKLEMDVDEAMKEDQHGSYVDSVKKEDMSVVSLGVKNICGMGEILVGAIEKENNTFIGVNAVSKGDINDDIYLGASSAEESDEMYVDAVDVDDKEGSDVEFNNADDKGVMNGVSTNIEKMDDIYEVSSISKIQVATNADAANKINKRETDRNKDVSLKINEEFDDSSNITNLFANTGEVIPQENMPSKTVHRCTDLTALINSTRSKMKFLKNIQKECFALREAYTKVMEIVNVEGATDSCINTLTELNVLISEFLDDKELRKKFDQGVTKMQNLREELDTYLVKPSKGDMEGNLKERKDDVRFLRQSARCRRRSVETVLKSSLSKDKGPPASDFQNKKNPIKHAGHFDEDVLAKNDSLEAAALNEEKTLIHIPNKKSDLDPACTVLALTGLNNLGNSCYMNSTIQCLNNTLPLVNYFLTYHYQHFNSNNLNGQLVDAFANLVKDLWSSKYKCRSPGNFKEAIDRCQSKFAGSRQEDCQEFLTCLMEGLHEGLNEGKDKPRIQEQSNEGHTEESSAKIPWRDHTLHNDSILVDLFQGQIKKTITCRTCNEQIVDFETFMYLFLPIPNTTECTLHECLKHFFAERRVTGNCLMTVKNCGEQSDTVIKLEIWKLPPILIIALKRFKIERNWWRKIDAPVDIPTNNVDFSRFVIDPHPKSFNLYAVSNHSGTLASGHYTACCRNPFNPKWYTFNDSIVQEASEPIGKSFQSSAAYVLYYTSMDKQSWTPSFISEAKSTTKK